jgi:hypothetical protein
MAATQPPEKILANEAKPGIKIILALDLFR